MVRTARETPRQRCPGWPDTPSPDPIGEVARRFTGNLRTAIAGRSIRAIAHDSGINHSTMVRILQGAVWPDIETIAKLEHGLHTDLWPGRIH